MRNLPSTQPSLHSHTQQPSHKDAATITHSHRPQTKLPPLLRDLLPHRRVRTHIHQPPQQPLPEDDPEHDPDTRDEEVQRLRGEEGEVEELEQAREVEGSDAEEGERGAGEEDAELVDGAVGGVEGAIVFEGGRGKGKEEGGGDTLVDGVFGDVDEEAGGG